ncbi:MAG: gerAA 1, partial [Firmicutes bacterium]|nr:gerAA 1 [Bacillota bacterium]
METIFSKTYKYLKNILVYKPPHTPTPFVLDDKSDKTKAKSSMRLENGLVGQAEELQILLRQAKQLKEVLEMAAKNLKAGQFTHLTQMKTVVKKLAAIKSERSPVRLAYDAVSQPDDRQVSAVLAENRALLEKLYKLPHNKDIIIRNLILPFAPPIKAILVFLDGM